MNMDNGNRQSIAAVVAAVAALAVVSFVGYLMFQGQSTPAMKVEQVSPELPRPGPPATDDAGLPPVDPLRSTGVTPEWAPTPPGAVNRPKYKGPMPLAAVPVGWKNGGPAVPPESLKKRENQKLRVPLAQVPAEFKPQVKATPPRLAEAPPLKSPLMSAVAADPLLADWLSAWQANRAMKRPTTPVAMKRLDDLLARTRCTSYDLFAAFEHITDVTVARPFAPAVVNKAELELDAPTTRPVLVDLFKSSAPPPEAMVERGRTLETLRQLSKHGRVEVAVRERAEKLLKKHESEVAR
jgi:hypothetical protein